MPELRKAGGGGGPDDVGDLEGRLGASRQTPPLTCRRVDGHHLRGHFVPVATADASRQQVKGHRTCQTQEDGTSHHI